MFVKALKASGNVLLKQKDVKKLRQELCRRFPLTCSEDKLLRLLLPAKCSLKKVTFHSMARVTVYVLEDSNEPIVVDLTGKGDLVFTVYALWKCPDLMPYLVVHAPVSQFVLRGADVMLPGVVMAPDDLQKLQQRELRCVFARGNPFPFAVGEILLNGQAIVTSSASTSAGEPKKGKVLKVLHTFGDELWQMGPKHVPNEGFLPDRILPMQPLHDDESEDDDDDDDDQVEEEEDKLVQEEDKEAAIVLDDLNLNVDDPETADQEIHGEQDQDGKRQPRDEQAILQAKKDMDVLLEKTFFHVIKCVLKQSQLPMLASAFYATMLVPSRPKGTQLAVQKSSYKKLSAFLKQMQLDDVIKMTEKDGVQSITQINKSHPTVRAHEPYEMEEDPSKDNEEQTPQGFVPGAFAPQVLEYFVPSNLTAVLLESVGLPNALEVRSSSSKGHKTKQVLNGASLRQLVMKYIDDNMLVDPVDQRMVLLNAALTDALFNRKPPPRGYPTKLSRPDILKLLLQQCQKYHAIKLFEGHDPCICAGELRKLEIHAEKGKRQNTVTLLSFYQQFGIDAEQFAVDAQRRWGCRALVRASEDKKKGQEIMLQGQFVDEIVSFLTTKLQINPKFLEVTYGKGVKSKK